MLHVVFSLAVALCCTHVIRAQQAVIHTNYGNITLQLYPQDAPKTVANFVNLSKTGFYNGTYFYRLAAGFVLQGGGYYPNQTSNVTVPLEYKLPNDQWSVGLARADSLFYKSREQHAGTCSRWLHHRWVLCLRSCH